ncbi:hypothetical protein MJN76_33420, partial [Salmonella enterica subsp. enterica serovar Anatum]|nr:hypothetical protein [Salmonella enterica subsp. enterica serovar Anatum]
ASGKPSRQGLSFRRLFSYSRREALELRRDPVRSTLALLGTVIRIEQQAAELGWEALHQQLQEIDPVAAARIHPNDPQRLSRALE